MNTISIKLFYILYKTHIKLDSSQVKNLSANAREYIYLYMWYEIEKPPVLVFGGEFNFHKVE